MRVDLNVVTSACSANDSVLILRSPPRVLLHLRPEIYISTLHRRSSFQLSQSSRWVGYSILIRKQLCFTITRTSLLTTISQSKRLNLFTQHVAITCTSLLKTISQSRGFIMIYTLCRNDTPSLLTAISQLRGLHFLCRNDTPSLLTAISQLRGLHFLCCNNTPLSSDSNQSVKGLTFFVPQ